MKTLLETLTFIKSEIITIGECYDDTVRTETIATDTDKSEIFQVNFEFVSFAYIGKDENVAKCFNELFASLSYMKRNEILCNEVHLMMIDYNRIVITIESTPFCEVCFDEE